MARHFAIQAVVEERVLWDVMMLLEQCRGRSILARPVALLERGEEHQEQELLPAPKSGGRSDPNNPTVLVRAAIMSRLAAGDEQITARAINELVPDARRHTIGQVLYQLKQNGTLRKIGPAVYGPPLTRSNGHAAKPPQKPLQRVRHKEGARHVDIALRVMRESGKEKMTAEELYAGLVALAPERTHIKPHQIGTFMKRDGYARSVEPGVYELTKKGREAPLLHPQHTEATAS